MMLNFVSKAFQGAQLQRPEWACELLSVFIEPLAILCM